MNDTILLSQVRASNCGVLGAIIRAVLTYGQALQLARERRQMSGPALALKVLGKDAKAKTLKAWANYLSRIENDRLKSGPGFQRLKEIAEGLEFQSVGSMLIELEVIQKEIHVVASTALTPQFNQTKDPPRTQTKVGGDDGTPVVQQATDPRTIFATLGRALIEAGARLGGSGLTVEQLDRSFLDAAQKKPKRVRRRAPNR